MSRVPAATIRVISGCQLRALLSMRDCIALMDATLRTISRGGAELPLRFAVTVPGTSDRMGVMSGWLSDPAALGVKIVSLFAKGPSHAGFVLLFDAGSGAPLAVIGADELTALRTAAASAAATRVLAGRDAGDLAILGTGVQAAGHLSAMAEVRTLRRIRVWGRSFQKAEAFAERHQQGCLVAIEPVAEVHDAVWDADLVCTTTGAPDPILKTDWLSPGVHVNLVGSSVQNTSEVTPDLVARARYFVDYRASAEAQAGELKRARDAGLVPADFALCEIGEVLDGRLAGRQSAADITVFKSLGNAAEDLAAATAIYSMAVDSGVGTVAEF